VLVLLAAAPGAVLGVSGRHEVPHASHGHDVHVSSPAIAVARGEPIVGWIAQGHHDNVLLAMRPATPGAPPVRVNPSGTSVDALHQAPGLAVGPGGEVYLSWSARKQKSEGVLFASDLMLSRSLDGGRTFEPPLRINADRPISNSFEDLTVAPDGTVLRAWIDSREGNGRSRTYVARVADQGRRLESEVRLDDEEACVCCRVALAAVSGENRSHLRVLPQAWRSAP
jgi:hypothetical protein